MGKKITGIEGQRFGNLVVVGKGVKKSRWRSYWRIKCDCGREKDVAGSSLIHGLTRSCGCLRNSTFSKNREKRYLPPGLSSRNSMFRMLQYAAKRRGYIWEISSSMFDVLTQSDCHYCGSPPSNEYKDSGCRGSFIYNGLDRKDNAEGYTPTNVVPCCKVCNRAKNTMSYKEFMRYLETIAQKSGNCWKI